VDDELVVRDCRSQFTLDGQAGNGLLVHPLVVEVPA
jgi:hypothetical protein